MLAFHVLPFVICFIVGIATAISAVLIMRYFIKSSNQIKVYTPNNQSNNEKNLGLEQMQ